VSRAPTNNALIGIRFCSVSPDYPSMFPSSLPGGANVVLHSKAGGAGVCLGGPPRAPPPTPGRPALAAAPTGRTQDVWGRASSPSSGQPSRPTPHLASGNRGYGLRGGSRMCGVRGYDHTPIWPCAAILFIELRSPTGTGTTTSEAQPGDAARCLMPACPAAHARTLVSGRTCARVSAVVIARQGAIEHIHEAAFQAAHRRAPRLVADHENFPGNALF